MVRHYHVAHQHKAIPVTVRIQFLKEDSAEFSIPEIGVIFISARGDKMNIGIIIELGTIFVQHHFLFNSGHKVEYPKG